MTKWIEYFERGVARLPNGFPHLVCGWPDEEHHITPENWGEECEEAYDEYCLDQEADGEPALPLDEWMAAHAVPYEDWRAAKREELDEDLGFSPLPCEICCALPGTRHAVTALPENPAENRDYVPLEVCGDCLMYIANGEEPCDEET